MQFFHLLSALTALALSTAALPVEQRKVNEPCPEDQPQYQELKRNQSTVFAHQLVGSSLGNEEVDNTCNELNEGCYEKWAQQGLVLDDMKKTICNTQGSQPNATLALPKVVQANSNVFSTQLLNAFDQSNTSNFQYLCNNLRYNQLSSFLLDNNKIIESACDSGKDQASPQPFTAHAQINASAVDLYHYTASKLYAYEYASAAKDDSQLNQWCTHAPDYHANWKHLQLKPDVVESTLCSVKQPLTVTEGKAQILKWSSKQFLAVIENISNAPGYNKWLCDNVDVNAMNNVGLDGKLIQSTICQHVEGK